MAFHMIELPRLRALLVTLIAATLVFTGWMAFAPKAGSSAPLDCTRLEMIHDDLTSEGTIQTKAASLLNNIGLTQSPAEAHFKKYCGHGKKDHWHRKSGGHVRHIQQYRNSYRTNHGNHMHRVKNYYSYGSFLKVYDCNEH
jgi:hypothetical protein